MTDCSCLVRLCAKSWSVGDWRFVLFMLMAFRCTRFRFGVPREIVSVGFEVDRGGLEGVKRLKVDVCYAFNKWGIIVVI